MIQGFSDYEKTEVKDFTEVEKINLGGHYCKILEVGTEVITSKKDGSTFNILKIKFDIDEPDDQAGFYNRKFANDAKKDALKAKWKGNHRLTIPTNASPDFAKESWKGFLTSIEKSNPGVTINGSTGFDENILVGKKFGGIFGLEELQLDDGKIITFSRIRFVRSTEKILEAQIPSVRLLDNTYMKYEEYLEKQQNEKNMENNSKSNEFSSITSDDDLPF